MVAAKARTGAWRGSRLLGSIIVPVPPVPVVVDTTMLPAATTTSAYSQTLQAHGGSSPTYTWAVTSGSLPAGLTLAAATGVISGTPTTQASYSFSVTATDTGALASAAQSLSIDVTSVEKPSEVFGMMIWVDAQATLHATNWNKVKAAGGDGWLFGHGFLPGYGSGSLQPFELALPANPGLANMRWGLHFNAVNNYNYWTPFVPWWDDGAWTSLCSTWANCVTQAYANGFQLVGLDFENYPVAGGTGEPSGQNVDYMGAAGTAAHYGKTVAETRAKVQERGAQWMTALVAAAGANVLKLYTYYSRFPNNWSEQVLAYASGSFDPTAHATRANAMFIDWWIGATSVSGWKEINFLEAFYYKDPQGPSGSSWDDAFTYDLAAYRSMFDTYFNGAGLAGRCRFIPFSWIDEDVHSGFDAYRGRVAVEGQYTKFAQYVVDPRNYGPMVADFSFANFALDYEFGPSVAGAIEVSPGALNAFGKFSRRAGTAPAAY